MFFIILFLVPGINLIDLESSFIGLYAGFLHVLINSFLNPVSTGAIFAIAAIVVLLVMSALISGSEIAFFSLSPAQVHDLKSHDVSINHTILGLLETPKRLLATILISNNFVNVAIVVISTYITNSLINFDQIPHWLADHYCNHPVLWGDPAKSLCHSEEPAVCPVHGLIHALSYPVVLSVQLTANPLYQPDRSTHKPQGIQYFHERIIGCD